jgi:hypothetical protein
MPDTASVVCLGDFVHDGAPAQNGTGDSAFFVITTPLLLKGVNNSLCKPWLPNTFIPICATLFGHYSQDDS